MALNKHIGIVWMNSQAVELFFHAFNLFQRFRMMAFQVMQLAVDLFGHGFQTSFRMVGANLIKLYIGTEVQQGEF